MIKFVKIGQELKKRGKRQVYDFTDKCCLTSDQESFSYSSLDELRHTSIYQL